MKQFFLFKQQTAYEIRISDWSSDVCSSDLKVKHALYGKIIHRSKKYHAHDEGNAYKEGETVRIEETAPISKLKTWKAIERVDTHKSPEQAACGLVTDL